MSIISFAVPNATQPKSQRITFQAQRHRITVALYNYTRDLLAEGLNNKRVATITGLGKNTVKEIDKDGFRSITP